MTDKDVVPYLQERLPDFTPVGAPRRLPEGNLNVVWRVPGAGRSVIVKYAPPYIAADPDTPLDPSRLTIEARCLDALGPDGRLSGLSQSAVRPPRVLDFNDDGHVLVMEDLGDRPTLGRWLHEHDPEAVRERTPAIGQQLGTFVGTLHAATTDDAACADTFDNRPMQETRHAVQYKGVTGMLRAAGVPDAEALGRRAEALGEALLAPGRCLTMGDLWPRSVLVAEDKLHLIDWELAHYGRPLQDVAHFRAHLWMLAHRAPSPTVANAARALRNAFRSAYDRALEAAKARLWTDQERRDAAVHTGAEILVRVLGPFQSGYLYEGLPPNHPAVQEAVTMAVDSIRAPESGGTWKGAA